MATRQKEFANRPFDKLNKQIDRANDAVPAPLPAPPFPPETKAVSDEELFTGAMSGVREIAGFRLLPCANASRRAAPTRRSADPDDEALCILEQIASGAQPINLSDTQEYIEWTNPSCRQGLTEDLHTGRFAVQGFLDLHGSTGAEVNEELDHFLEEAFRNGWRCVKIIHGRGLRSVRGPVLKDAVVRRLSGRYRRETIAFVSARQCDGGLGALYVLLRGK
jgi:DNA-nicking Smr family endonuclease